MGLREAVLRTSDKHPCFSLEALKTTGETGDTSPPNQSKGKNDATPLSQDKGPQNTYEGGFTVTRTNTGGLTFNFQVFSLGASETQNISAANTLKISFKSIPNIQ
jgi:hypothetical protein